MNAKDRELLAAVFEHETVNLDIHLDDCEGGACMGCDPQHLAEKAAAQLAEGTREAIEWNEKYPVGTPVVAYPGARGETGLTTRTRSRAWQLGHGSPVVAVEGRGGGILLTRIDVIDGGRPMSTLLTVSEAAGILLNLSGLGHRYSAQDAQTAVRKMVTVDYIRTVTMRQGLYVPREELTGLTVIEVFSAMLAGGESR
jgi:hypothetical protein